MQRGKGTRLLAGWHSPMGRLRSKRMNSKKVMESTDVTSEETIPLDILAIRGAARFQAYLTQHNLNPIDVAVASGVRYLTIWNIQRGFRVTRLHAAKVRAGLFQLTGIPFIDQIAMQDAEPEGNQ